MKADVLSLEFNSDFSHCDCQKEDSVVASAYYIEKLYLQRLKVVLASLLFCGQPAELFLSRAVVYAYQSYILCLLPTKVVGIAGSLGFHISL